LIDVSPEIHSLSDLGGLTPVQFLSVLKEKKYPEYTFWTKFKHWISKKDVPSLLLLVNSKDTCASVALSSSSYYSSQTSTVGHEALFMLEGYRKEEYPPGLNSLWVDDPNETKEVKDAVKKANEELIQWCRNQISIP
jgi:hypothetical protein